MARQFEKDEISHPGVVSFYRWLMTHKPDVKLTAVQVLLTGGLYSTAKGGGKTFIVRLWNEYEDYLEHSEEVAQNAPEPKE